MIVIFETKKSGILRSGRIPLFYHFLCSMRIVITCFTFRINENKNQSTETSFCDILLTIIGIYPSNREWIHEMEFSMRKIYKGFLAGTLAVAIALTPANTVFAKTEVVEQTADGEQKVTYYEISFDANKGKKVKTTLTLTYKDTYGKLPKTTREGYEFLGWYTKKSGGTKVTAKTVFKGKNDQILYAHWKKNVTEESPAAEEPEQTPVQEVSETDDMVADVPATIATKLVAYVSNVKTDYKQNNYNGFLVLKNFKSKYLYCQYDYDRFIGSNGKNGGCTATADAMLASVYMDKPFSPNDEGWVSGVGATWTNSMLIDGSKTFSVKRQCQETYDYLNEGKPVLIRVTGHTVTAIGLRKGVDRASITASDILIADPADAKVKCADEMGWRKMEDATSFGLRIPKASLPANE